MKAGPVALDQADYDLELGILNVLSRTQSELVITVMYLL